MKFKFLLILLFFFPLNVFAEKYLCIKDGFNYIDNNSKNIEIKSGFLFNKIYTSKKFEIIESDKFYMNNLNLSFDKSIHSIIGYFTKKENFSIYDKKMKVLKIYRQNLKRNEYLVLSYNTLVPKKIFLNISDHKLFLNIEHEFMIYENNKFNYYFKLPIDILNNESDMYIHNIDSYEKISELRLVNLSTNNIYKPEFSSDDILKDNESYKFLESIYPYGIDISDNISVYINENTIINFNHLRNVPILDQIPINELYLYNSYFCDNKDFKLYLAKDENNYFEIYKYKYVLILNNFITAQLKKINLIEHISTSKKIYDLKSNNNKIFSFNTIIFLSFIVLSFFLFIKRKDYSNQILVIVSSIEIFFLNLNYTFLILSPFVFSNFFTKKFSNVILTSIIFIFLYLSILKNFDFDKINFIALLFLIIMIISIFFNNIKYLTILIIDIIIFNSIDASDFYIYLYPMLIFQSFLMFNFLIKKINEKYLIYFICSILILSSIISLEIFVSILSVPFFILIFYLLKDCFKNIVYKS